MELKIGGRYNWKHQEERLVYMGVEHYPGNGMWHQFALVDKPDECWCEVRASDLEHFEETDSIGTDRLDLPVRGVTIPGDIAALEARILGGGWHEPRPHQMKKGKATKAEKKANKKARTRAWIEQQGEQHVG